jgi:hypothetical protein
MARTAGAEPAEFARAQETTQHSVILKVSAASLLRYQFSRSVLGDLTVSRAGGAMSLLTTHASLELLGHEGKNRVEPLTRRFGLSA